VWNFPWGIQGIVPITSKSLYQRDQERFGQCSHAAGIHAHVKSPTPGSTSHSFIAKSAYKPVEMISKHSSHDQFCGIASKSAKSGIARQARPTTIWKLKGSSEGLDYESLHQQETWSSFRSIYLHCHNGAFGFLPWVLATSVTTKYLSYNWTWKCSKH
jgi:hypothetical protein